MISKSSQNIILKISPALSTHSLFIKDVVIIRWKGEVAAIPYYDNDTTGGQ